MILLTGGTGFVGRHLVRQLLADGCSVRALVRSPGQDHLPQAVARVCGDLTDPASLLAAVEGVEAVVHAGAALGGNAASASGLEPVNVAGTAALARAAREAGVRQFVHVSSAGVYGDGATPSPHREPDRPAPGTAYERSKLAAEQALAERLEGSGVHWTVLRPQGLYAADRPATAALFREVAQRRLWLHGPTRVVVHPTHVRDLVNAIRLVLARPELHREVINVGGERALEYPELLAMIGQRVRHAPLQVRMPAWRWRNRAVDIGKARRMLGFEPVPLASGLDETAAALNEPRTTGS